MGMRRKERRKREAAASPHAVATHAVAHEYPDPELGHFHHRAPYSMWSAMKYVLALSVLLWWLPTIGQMIAGYIGGRRAGGQWRGVVAAIAPVAFILFLSWALERGLLGPWFAGLRTIPIAIGNTIATLIPPLAPYVEFVLGYLDAFVRGLSATMSMGSNGYLVTIVFAYIGGILADQARREAGAGRGTSVGISIAQPLLANPFRKPYEPWEDVHAERFEALRKIPVRGAAQASAAGQSGPRPHKVDGKAAVSRLEEGARPAGEAQPKPERKELNPHDKEVATRRFVERALRQYEAAHRR